MAAIRPMGKALEDQFDVALTTGTKVLNDQKIPDADYIVTGSMGGLLALEYLPAMCKKLVLISSTAKFCAGENYDCGIHEKILKRMILQLKRSPDAVLSAFYENVHFPHAALKTDPEASLEELVSGLEYLLHSDLRDTISKITIPVLLMHGDQDRIIPSSASDWLQKNVPNSQLKIYNKQGHALAAHHFGPLISHIKSFINSRTEP